MYVAGASLVRWSSQSHLLLREGMLQPVVGSQIHHEAVSWMANWPDERRFFRGREGESDGARAAGHHHWSRGTFDGEFSVRENNESVNICFHHRWPRALTVTALLTVDLAPMNWTPGSSLISVLEFKG